MKPTADWRVALAGAAAVIFVLPLGAILTGLLFVSALGVFLR